MAQTKTDWRTGMRSLGSAGKIDWRTGIRGLAKSEGIVAEPVKPGEFSPSLEFPSELNWADKKILEYEQGQREAARAQAKRDALERRLKRERLEKRLELMSPYAFEKGAFAPVAEKYQEIGESITRKATPESRREMLRMGMGYAGGLSKTHPMILAGLGGATAESLYQMGQHITGSPKAPRTMGEATKRIGTAGGIEFGEEGIARALMKVLSPGSKIAKGRRATVEWMRQRGIEPTLAQATESRGAIGILENIAEGSFTGGPAMRKHKANVERLLANYGDDIVARFGGMSDIEAGRVLKELILKKKSARQAITKSMYEEVARLSKGRLVNTKPLKRKIAKALREIGMETVKGNELTSIMPSLENKQLIRILREGMLIPDEVPFDVINKQIRQRIGQIAFAHPMEKTGQLFTKETDRILSDIYFEIGKIYQDPKYGLPAEAAKVLKSADFITSDTHNIWDKKLIQRLVKENPEKVIDSILKKGAITNVDEVIAATRLFETLPSEGKQVLKGAFVKDLITDKAIQTSGGGSRLSGTKLLDYIDRGIQQDVLEKFMSKSEIDELKFFGDALRVYDAKPVALGGGITIKILQAGALMEIGHQAIPGAKGKTDVGLGSSVGFLLGPKAISYLFTQPTLIRSLSNALISEGGPKQAVRFLTRIFANKTLKGYIKEDEKDREKHRREVFKQAAERLSKQTVF